MTQLDVPLRGSPQRAPEDLIEEARRHQRRRIRVIAVERAILLRARGRCDGRRHRRKRWRWEPFG